MSATAPPRRFHAHHVGSHADNYFFAAVCALILATVFAGFARSYYLVGVFHAHLPSRLVHLHGAVFTCWILLLVTQIALVSIGRVKLHMHIGIAGMFLAGLLVLVGSATLLAAVHRNFDGKTTPLIFAGDTLLLLAFSLLIALGFRLRRDGPAHKRLMLFATIVILGPAVARLQLTSLLQVIAALDIYLVFFVSYDLWSLRRIHRATIWGSLSLIAAEAGMFLLGNSAFWHRLTLWIQSR